MAPKSDQSQSEKNPVCALASGGADSAVMLMELAAQRERVFPVYVRNGLLWEEAEVYWLRRFLRAVEHPAVAPLTVLEFPMQDVYRTHWSMTGDAVPDGASGWREVYLPGRNLILLSKTAVFCALNGIGAIALGPLKTNHFTDSSPEFFEAYRRLIETALGRRIDILTPLARLSKPEVIERGRSFPMELTFSCLNPQGKDHCGACNKCAERMESFAQAGMEDRTQYGSNEQIPSRRLQRNP